jgi:hypothetical protein
MKGWSYIDNLFKSGHRREYSYDEGLWAEMDKSLYAALPPAKKSNFRYFFIDLFLVISAILVFTLTRNETAPISNNGLILNVIDADGDSEINDGIIKKNAFPEVGIREPEDVGPTKDNLNNSKVLVDEPNSRDYRFIETTVVPEKSDVLPPEPEHIELLVETVDNTTTSNPSSFKFEPLEFWLIPLKQAIYPSIDYSYLESITESNSKRISSLGNNFRSVQLEQMVAINGTKKYDKLSDVSANYRGNSETFSSSIESNLLLSIQRRSIFVQFGIGRRNMKELVVYERPTTEFEITEGPLVLLQDSFVVDGKQVTLLGRRQDTTSRIGDNPEEFYSGTNSYTYFKIPVRLGLVRRFERLTISGWLGAEVLILSSFNGTYIDKSLSNVYQDGALPKSNVLNFNLGYGLQCGYNLNSKLIVGMSFQQQNMMKSTHTDLNQKFRTSNLGGYLNLAF